MMSLAMLIPAIDYRVVSFLLVPPLLALCMFAFGFYLLRRQSIFGKSAWEEQVWRRDLLLWRVSTPENDNFFQVAQDIAQYWKPIFVTVAFSVGIAMLLFSVIWNVLSLLTTGTLTGLLEPNGNLLTLGLALFVALGYGCGAVLGMWRARKRARDRVTYGDLRQRRLTDYRSIVFPCVLAGLIAYIIILTYLLAPYGGSDLHLQFISGRSINLPKSPWLLGVVPAFMLVCIGILEAAMARLVVFARLLIMPDPVVARRADDMLRAMEIGMLTGMEFWMIGTLMQVQCRLLVPLGTASQNGFYQIALFVAILVGMFLVPLGLILIGFFRGRLGGKVSGWIGW